MEEEKQVLEISKADEALIDPTDRWTVEEEAAVVRKMDMYLMPFVMMLYLFNYLDRGNMSNAKVANTDTAESGMLYDLGMTQLQYNFALGFFFVGYSLGEFPCNFFMKAWGARRWFTRIMITWGIFAMIMGAVNNFAGMMVVRFLFGLAEAGFFPGMAFFFVLFYRPYERARRSTWLYMMATFASAVSGLLATGLSNLHNAGNLAGWRWIFIIEGIPSILAGVATWFYLPDYPADCWFLNEREKFIAVHRLPKDDVKKEMKAFVLSEYLQMFKDGKVWGFALQYLLTINCIYANSGYLPTVIKALGFTSTQAQLLTVPIYVWATIVLPFVGQIADRTKANFAVLSGCVVVGLVGYIIEATVTLPGVQYFGLFLMISGVSSRIGVSFAWYSQMTHGEGATKVAGALGFISAIGHLGGISGPQIFQADDAPRYVRAWIILCVFAGSELLLINFIQWVYGYSKAAKEDVVYHKVHDKIHQGGEQQA